MNLDKNLTLIGALKSINSTVLQVTNEAKQELKVTKLTKWKPAIETEQTGWLSREVELELIKFAILWPIYMFLYAIYKVYYKDLDDLFFMWKIDRMFHLIYLSRFVIIKIQGIDSIELLPYFAHTSLGILNS